ncbi:MAG TPA: nickel pincer cofactor biosynthesis protein LarB, partial [Nitrososphaera sp.]|nr:nickel pincer cofactor biosynthesis protein LarB [Nitrososphaera sp.]
AFASGMLNLEDAEKQIALHSVEAIGQMAKLDVGREHRRGMPEVILAERKEFPDLVRIATAAVQSKGQVVISRIPKDYVLKAARALRQKKIRTEGGTNCTTLVATSDNFRRRMDGSRIGIMAAGTSDIGVAEEARLMAMAMGCESTFSYDIGIAGMHRIFPAIREMMAKNVGAIVVVAGMEGALASVVASLSDVPVIGVPTSVGYGFGSNGVAALSSMLQSCTLGLAVVNIDNGIGAGAFAAHLAKKIKR